MKAEEYILELIPTPLNEFHVEFVGESKPLRKIVRCRNCRHRDPEDHKCDCGGVERQGCPFPVNEDYFCAYGEE